MRCAVFGRANFASGIPTHSGSEGPRTTPACTPCLAELGKCERLPPVSAASTPANGAPSRTLAWRNCYFAGFQFRASPLPLPQKEIETRLSWIARPTTNFKHPASARSPGARDPAVRPALGPPEVVLPRSSRRPLARGPEGRSPCSGRLCGLPAW